MIGYVTLGTNDKDRAKKFFDQLFATIEGVHSFAPNDRLVMWVKDQSQPMLAIAVPYDEKPASHGNGTMVAFKLDDKAAVEVLYAKALELGGADEGAPGMRTENFYGGYFRDLDGNKFVGFCLV